MAVKKKLIGYYSSGGKCRKAYNFYDRKKKRYLKQKKTATGRKILSKHRVYKKKSNCVKHIKSQQNKMTKKQPKHKMTKKQPKHKMTKKEENELLKDKYKKAKEYENRNAFGDNNCNVSAPYFGLDVSIPPRGWKWPGGGAADMFGQFELN